MRNVVVQMGISIDGYVSGGPEEDIGSGEPLFKDLPVERRLRLAEVTPYPDGTVISIYRRPR